VDTAFLRSLFGRGVLIVGLDVDIRELNAALGNAGPFSARLSRELAPDRPILSMMWRGCGSGSFSDWMDNWDAAGFVLSRADQVAAYQASGPCQPNQRSTAQP